MKIYPYKTHQVLLPFLAFLVLSGCTSNETADHTFGDSVRHTIAIQTARPRSQEIGMDGTKAALALQKYQKDVGDPKLIDKEEIASVSVGTQ